MTKISKISFVFAAVSTLNLEELRQRTGSRNLQHLYDTTLSIYDEYLDAKEAGRKLVMTHPAHDSIEIDDREDPRKHRNVGIITISTDLARAQALAVKGGFVATQNMLTRAFILRERITDAFEHQWRVGFLIEAEQKIQYLKREQFCLMNMPGPQQIH